MYFVDVENLEMEFYLINNISENERDEKKKSPELDGKVYPIMFISINYFCCTQKINQTKFFVGEIV